jgi:hypothetical protein
MQFSKFWSNPLPSVSQASCQGINQAAFSHRVSIFLIVSATAVAAGEKGLPD